jgi:hypothetical protein
MSTDIVLDVNNIKNRRRGLAKQVTLLEVENAQHDIFCHQYCEKRAFDGMVDGSIRWNCKIK